MTSPVSLRRLRALLAKEFIQMRRDRLTFGMMIGIPLMQLMLFGYAINGDPSLVAIDRAARRAPPAAVLVVRGRKR